MSISNLLAVCPSLTLLNLAGSYALTDATLRCIAETIGPNLVSLGLARCPLISDDGLRHICLSSPNLRQIVLDNCTDLTEASVRMIADKCKKVEILSLCHLNRIHNDEYVLLSPVEVAFPQFSL